jgi:hypothetical protein
VDHTYDCQGYGLIFKLEEEQNIEKVDVHMQEANHDDGAKDVERKK